MSFRTLSAFNVKANWPSSWGTSGTLVLTLDKSVVGSDSVEYPATQNQGKALSTLGFHFESAITVSTGTATCASISNLPTTDTVTPAHTAHYNIYLYDSKGRMREKIGSNFHLHESVNGSSTSFTWEQWVVAQQFSQGNSQLPMIGDRVTMQAMVDAIARGHASDSYEGITYLDTAPLSSSHPEAVGSNSPLLLDYVNPKAYGALGDGTGATITSADVTAHTVGTRYPWQGTYVVGTDTKDYVGLQEAVYAAFGYTGSEHGTLNPQLNKKLFIPAGTYITNKTITLKYLSGGVIEGAGKYSSTIKITTANTPAVTTNGLHYTNFRGLRFLGGAASTTPLFELNWDGSSAARYTGALQGNTFDACMFDGNNAGVEYGIRIGASGGMGSENLFLNCHWQWFTTAGFKSSNYNALANTIIGGNFQSCPNYAINALQGSITVIGTGFQNGMTNFADINVENSADDHSSIIGCRTESGSFVVASNGHRVLVQNCNQVIASSKWSAGATINSGDYYQGSLSGTNGILFRASNSGTTGGVEPSWPTSGTVTDNGITWTALQLNAVIGANVEVRGCTFNFSRISLNNNAGTDAYTVNRIEDNVFSRVDWLENNSYRFTNQSTIMSGNQVHLGGGVNSGASIPSSYQLNGAGVSSRSHFEIGANPLLFDTGSGIGAFTQVGLIRGDGTNAILGLLGNGLGKVSASGSNQAGSDMAVVGGLSTGNAAGGKVNLRVSPAGSSGSSVNAPVTVGQFDANTTANETRFLIYDITAGTLQRVSIGAADSGGAGYRALRIPN